MNIILIDNHGFSSIGGLSESVGSDGFGTRYVYREKENGQLSGDYLPVDFAANARSLGAHVIETGNLPEFKSALQEAKKQSRTTVIVVEVDREERVPGYESWWDVPVAEVSEVEAVQEVYAEYKIAKEKERYLL